jgi:hypothetical protein
MMSPESGEIHLENDNGDFSYSSSVDADGRWKRRRRQTAYDPLSASSIIVTLGPKVPEDLFKWPDVYYVDIKQGPEGDAKLSNFVQHFSKGIARCLVT